MRAFISSRSSTSFYYLGAPDHVALAYLVAPEERVRPVQVVQDSEDAVALVELEVVEVVGLGRREEWEVVAGVGVQRGQEGEAVPQPSWKHK